MELSTSFSIITISIASNTVYCLLNTGGATCDASSQLHLHEPSLASGYDLAETIWAVCVCGLADFQDGDYSHVDSDSKAAEECEPSYAVWQGELVGDSVDQPATSEHLEGEAGRRMCRTGEHVAQTDQHEGHDVLKVVPAGNSSV